MRQNPKLGESSKDGPHFCNNKQPRINSNQIPWWDIRRPCVAGISACEEMSSSGFFPAGILPWMSWGGCGRGSQPRSYTSAQSSPLLHCDPYPTLGALWAALPTKLCYGAPRCRPRPPQGNPKIIKISQNLVPEASQNRPLKNTSKKLSF